MFPENVHDNIFVSFKNFIPRSEVDVHKYSEKCRKIHRKTSVLEFLFNEVVGLQPTNLLKQRLQ